MKLYNALARDVMMHHAATNSGDYAERAEALVKEYMPSGSGFDSGTKIDLEKSNKTRLVFTTSFHHMDDNGMYCGWSDHTVIFSASLDGHDIRVTGRNKRDIKEYISETFFGILCDTEINRW